MFLSRTVQHKANGAIVTVVQAARLQCRQRKPQAARLHYDFLGSHGPPRDAEGVLDPVQVGGRYAPESASESRTRQCVYRLHICHRRIIEEPKMALVLAWTCENSNSVRKR